MLIFFCKLRTSLRNGCEEPNKETEEKGTNERENKSRRLDPPLDENSPWCYRSSCTTVPTVRSLVPPYVVFGAIARYTVPVLYLYK